MFLTKWQALNRCSVTVLMKEYYGFQFCNLPYLCLLYFVLTTTVFEHDKIARGRETFHYKPSGEVSLIKNPF